MDLHAALAQITEIRQRMARSQVFRGYRAAMAAFSAVVAFVAGAVQPWIAPEPSAQFRAWLVLWVGAAVLNVLAVGMETLIRYRRTESQVERQMTLLAVEQFLPCIVAGGILTAILGRFSPQSLWMLPGLWAMLFGLGLLAVRTLLPHAMAAVGAWYILAGAAALAFAQGDAAFCLWSMAVPFGVGQLLAALVLYWKLERHVRQAEQAE